MKIANRAIMPAQIATATIGYRSLSQRRGTLDAARSLAGIDVVRRFISLERCGLSIRNAEAHADRPTPLAPLLALPGASPFLDRMRAALANKPFERLALTRQRLSWKPRQTREELRRSNNAQGRPGKCCGGGGYLPTGSPPPKIEEAVFDEYRLSPGCGAQIRQVGVRFELCCYGCSNGIYNYSMGIARKCADDFDPRFDLGVTCVDDSKRCNSLRHQGKRRAHILSHCKFRGSSVP